MPRIRTIKPQFWLDENLGTIQREARLLYIGLWNLSDDQGVFEWRPARIKIQLFPYDIDISADNIESWLQMLVTSGDVIKFNTNGDIFGYIPTFLKHQDIVNPSKWKFAEIPIELSKPLPIPSIVLSKSSPSPIAREKEKESIIGIKEKESNNKGELVKEVFARIDNLRGYRPPKRAAEAASILRMLKTYSPDQIIKTWETIKAEPFYKDKELFLMSVESQIGAKINGKTQPTKKQLPTTDELRQSWKS
jgi:hypothetical protein